MPLASRDPPQIICENNGLRNGEQRTPQGIEGSYPRRQLCSSSACRHYSLPLSVAPMHAETQPLQDA